MKPGNIVLVRFPFADLKQDKKRPALVLCVSKFTAKQSLVTIAMVTSRIDGVVIQGDVLLDEWKPAGLLHPSLARLSKLATIDSDLIEKVLGNVSGRDLKLLRSAIQKQFKAWL